MDEISQNDVHYVRGWLQSFIGTATDLTIQYIENLNVDDVDAMVVLNVNRRLPAEHHYTLANVANWPLVQQLRWVIGSLSRRNGHIPDERVRALMLAEIQRRGPRGRGPDGPTVFEDFQDAHEPAHEPAGPRGDREPRGPRGDLDRQLQRMSECLPHCSHGTGPYQPR